MDQQPVSSISFGVLGPVAAWDRDGSRVDLRGPRHREVLALLIAARGRVVPVSTLVDELTISVGAVRTFVGALRTALEPERTPRMPGRLLVTEGPGYALRASAVDAWRFEDALAEDEPATLEEALGWWRGPAYADFADAGWARAERARLAELRLRAVERLAEARMARGPAADAVPDLEAHVAEHPWREDAWGLLALAHYRAGRQGDALAVLRRARTRLIEELGLQPGPGLRRLETDILDHAGHLGASHGFAAGRGGASRGPAADAPDDFARRDAAGHVGARGPVVPVAAVERVWARAAADYDRTVATGARARLESTVGLLRDLAVTGGLEAARRHRAAAVAAAEELGDPELTARVIGAYDVPAIWTRVDDPPQAARIVAAAERTLTALGPDAHDAARARLLATVALESRGTRARRGPEAAREAEALARRLDDPALLGFALNAVFIQSCGRAGLAPRRDAIGAELVELATRHGLAGFEVLGHLIRLQARCALADFAGADLHAAAADALAARHERPLVGVFTAFYAALQRQTEAGYREAAARLEGAGMPGLQDGLLGLALLCLGVPPGDEGFGPYEPWCRPLVARGREAAIALRSVPEPPHDLLLEVMWCLVARAAVALDDERALARARGALSPAAGEHAAGSGIVTLGPVSSYLTDT